MKNSRQTFSRKWYPAVLCLPTYMNLSMFGWKTPAVCIVFVFVNKNQINFIIFIKKLLYFKSVFIARCLFPNAIYIIKKNIFHRRIFLSKLIVFLSRSFVKLASRFVKMKVGVATPTWKFFFDVWKKNSRRVYPCFLTKKTINKKTNLELGVQNRGVFKRVKTGETVVLF